MRSDLLEGEVVCRAEGLGGGGGVERRSVSTFDLHGADIMQFVRAYSLVLFLKRARVGSRKMSAGFEKSDLYPYSISCHQTTHVPCALAGKPLVRCDGTRGPPEHRPGGREGLATVLA